MRVDDSDNVTEVQRITEKKKTGNTGIKPHTSPDKIEVHLSTVGGKN